MAKQDDADFIAAVKTIRTFGWKVTTVASAILLALVLTIPMWLVGQSETRADLKYATKPELSQVQQDMAAVKESLSAIKASLNRIENKINGKAPDSHQE